ncbi:MAG TPA: Ig-like domain-containing protein, partial [Syntrophomonas sp.]|nr:Ig-like domain-containing protein [Syntrophomonas sp.]
TAGNSMAEINFEDGSGLLLKENARLTVTDAYGRSYIRHDGTAGVAVEWLNINMAGGELFGAVPTTMSNSEENQADNRKELQTTGFMDQFKTPLLASLNSPGLIAAAAEDNKTAPWYNTSKTKRVKVKIDMPWGVAAVRGTQFFVGQNSGGTDISVLEGTVTATGNSPRGTNTYDIGAGQFARIGSSGSFTSPPAPMNQNQLRRWVNEQQWVRERAEQIMQNQETDIISSSNQSSSTQQPGTGTLDDINQALQEAQDSIRQNTSGGSSGGSFRYITSLQLPEDTQLTVAYRQAYELPAVVTAYYSDDTNSTVSVTWNPNTVDTSVVGTQTFTGTVSGYSGTVTLNLTVIMEELGEILGSYELEDGLILDNYIYDNGVLTQDLSINPSDALLARANYYEILSSYSSNPIISMQPLDQSVRVMKKLFDNLERLRIVFYDESENIVAYAGFNSSGVLTNLVNRTISGRISLPEGMNAPAGGMDIILYAYDQVFNYTVPLTIREGEHEADYSIAVAYNYSFMPYGLSTMAESEVSVNGYNLNDRNIRNPEMRPMFSDSNTQGYQLHYQIIGSYGADLVMSGQYNETIDVSDSSQSEINLQLEKGQLILGTFKLPEDLTADSDLDIYVEAVDHSGEYYKYYYDSVLIQSGQNEVPFSLTVPGQISYLLQYYIYGQASHAEQVNGHLLREGYYTLSGASFDEEEATQIRVEDAAVNDIDFVMASGKQIYGTISLANGQMSPQDISVYVEAYIQATNDYISEQYVLPQDSQSVDFALVVPASQVSLYIYFNDEYREEFSFEVSTDDYELNPEINYWNEGKLSPDDITAPAVLIGDTAYGLNSFYFGASSYMWELYSFGSNHAYFKSEEGLWFDLTNPQINSVEDLTTANACSGNLPPINYNESQTGILRVVCRSDSGDSLNIIISNVPDYTIKIYDAGEGGNLLGSAQSEYVEGSYAAQITITESVVASDGLYVTFTPEEGIEQRRIPLNILYPPLR